MTNYEPKLTKKPQPLREYLPIGVLLAAVILLAAYFRYTGVNWDDYTHFHPDERFLTSVVTNIGVRLNFTLNGSVEGYATINEQIERCRERYPQTNGLGGFFDAQCSSFNPHNAGHGLYVYGTLPLFAANWLSDTVATITNDPIWSSYEGAHIVWRLMNATVDIGTVLVVFLIGAKLHTRWVGLLAALFYACMPLAIQKSHFATTNAMTAFFVALCLLVAIRVQHKGKLFDYALFGLVLAASVSSRINTAPIVGVVILAALLRMLPVLDRRLSWDERSSLLTANFGGLVLAASVFFVAFRLMSPYAFMGPDLFGLRPNPRFFADIATAQHLVSGESESPPNWQWVARPGYLFPLWNMILWGMGIASGLAGWAGWVWSGYQLARAKPRALQNAILFAWVAAYFVFIGNLWVMSMRYYLPLYPAIAVLGSWCLVEVVRYARSSNASIMRRTFARVLLAGAAAFSILWGLMFTNIYRNQMSAVQASHWIWENVPGDFAMAFDDQPDAPLINIPIYNRNLGNPATDNKPLEQLSQLEQGVPLSVEFVAPADGTISRIHAPHLADPLNTAIPKTLQFAIAKNREEAPLSQATFSAVLTRTQSAFGDSHDIRLDVPLTVKKGERFIFTVEVLNGGSVSTAGAIMVWDGDWEEVVPVKVCTLPDGMTLADGPPPGLLSAQDCNGRSVWDGLLNGYKMQLYWDDVEAKRELWTEILDNVDYIFIGTNRRYDSQSRIMTRWPMTQAYYEALFSGALGFELAAVYHETFEFGPLRISDQYLPTYTGPKWLNEFEAEEAFHVYDHPAALIFRKTENYTSANMRRILYSVPLNQPQQILTGYNCPNQPTNAYCDSTLIGVVPLYSLPADKAPTQLRFPPDLRQLQYDSGTWSSRFNSESVLNTQPLITIAMWWLAIMVFGFCAFPLLFAVFPALADRGYSLSKLAGVVLTAWFAWFMSSIRVPMWSQSGITLALFVLGIVSLWFGLRSRQQIWDYLRQHWRRLMWIEAITLAAFVFFLLVRLTNPDLWHYAKGGEKPMDFAYFNAVLRSTTFPPIDPWYAQGYLNYYYFGFVIVAAPTLLLGIVPSIAYNLIIPTLFALTAVAAFSGAFNVVSAWWENRRPVLFSDIPSATTHQRRLGNPWVAGIAALMLAVVLGNLDTIRVFGLGVANLGGYRTSLGLQQYLVEQYTSTYGIPPEGEALLQINQRAERNYFSDRLNYELHHAASLVGSLLRGGGQLFAGAPLPIGTDRWYWGPTRVLAEAPGVEGNAITEMPYFTFLYGDLHAHMIDMPVMLFVMSFLLNQLLLAKQDNRRKLEQFVAIALGALAVGITRATNTWDWVTFLLLSVVGLGYIWWLAWQRFTRWSVLSLLLRVGGFLVLHVLLLLPFVSWFATTSDSVTLWQYGKTPLWAYFDIHGLFLCLIVSLLIWETARWFRSIYVRSLRGTWLWLLVGALAFALICAGSSFAAMLDYQVALVVVPLLVWIGVLFFRPGQSLSMQFVLVLIGLGLSLTLGVEVVVLGADIGRQNTVFKFYIQTWLLFSVACGAAFAWLIQSSSEWSNRLRNGWFLITGILVMLAALYPLMATRGRAADRMGEPVFTLDGMEYMKTSQYAEQGVWLPLQDDYYLIRWMQENIEGSPVIMEGRSAHEYLWGGRISVYTGLPAILGWRHHQTQQRTLDFMTAQVNQRVNNVNAFYATTDIATALEMIAYFDVRYIVVSGLERAYYPLSGLAKFDTMSNQGWLEIVYQHNDAALYKVNQEAVKNISVAYREN